VPIESTSGSCTAPGFLSTGPDSTVSSFSVGPTSSSATISGLTNGTSYAVAVTAQDAFLNNGTISNLVCDTPITLNDFFETYRNDGGQAGGGFCSLENLGAPAGGATFAIVSFATLLALTRRRERDAENKARKERASRS
jgi:hypothetical protein